MLIHELTDLECRVILARASVGRLASARNNQPYVVPIRLDLDGEFLYGFATLGQKIEWMRENPLVCVEVDELITPRQWASVIVFGRYEELPKAGAYESSRRVADRLFQARPSWWEPASVRIAGHAQRAPIVFRIRIDRMTGRRAGEDTAKPPDLRKSARETTGWRRLTQAVLGVWPER